jgi:hypothetical protein
MAGRIDRLDGESKLIAVEESPYDSESLLQALFADHPDLLAGDQINTAFEWVLSEIKNLQTQLPKPS